MIQAPAPQPINRSKDLLKAEIKAHLDWPIPFKQRAEPTFLEAIARQNCILVHYKPTLHRLINKDKWVSQLNNIAGKTANE
ncbi:MAG: hypothetical protein ACTS3T_20720 [Almyronema sp.]